MRTDEEHTGFSVDREAEGNLSFAAFVFAHVGCGDEGTELRVGERLLLEWCPACGKMEIFGFSGRVTTASDGSGTLA